MASRIERELGSKQHDMILLQIKATFLEVGFSTETAKTGSTVKTRVKNKANQPRLMAGIEQYHSACIRLNARSSRYEPGNLNQVSPCCEPMVQTRHLS